MSLGKRTAGGREKAGGGTVGGSSMAFHGQGRVGGLDEG